MVELVVHYKSVGSPAHDGGDLRRVLVTLGHLPLLSRALGDCVAEEKVQEEVANADQHLEEAQSPVEQSHLIVIDQPKHGPRFFQAAYEIPHVCALGNSPRLIFTLNFLII